MILSLFICCSATHAYPTKSGFKITKCEYALEAIPSLYTDAYIALLNSFPDEGLSLDLKSKSFTDKTLQLFNLDKLKPTELRQIRIYPQFNATNFSAQFQIKAVSRTKVIYAEHDQIYAWRNSEEEFYEDSIFSKMDQSKGITKLRQGAEVGFLIPIQDAELFVATRLTSGHNTIIDIGIEVDCSTAMEYVPHPDSLKIVRTAFGEKCRIPVLHHETSFNKRP